MITSVTLKNYRCFRDVSLTLGPLTVAVQEFEAWLIADHALVARLTDTQIEQSVAPEDLPAGQAKQLLEMWCGTDDPRSFRLQIAKQCNLSVVAQRCPAFQEFVDDLKSFASRIGTA